MTEIMVSSDLLSGIVGINVIGDFGDYEFLSCIDTYHIATKKAGVLAS